jgi:ankyrin repeat protein
MIKKYIALTFVISCCIALSAQAMHGDSGTESRKNEVTPGVGVAELPSSDEKLLAILKETDVNGYTPMHLAAAHENEEVIKILLAHGVSINIKNKADFTPINLLCGNPNYAPNKFALLFKYGGDIEEPNTDGLSPLHHAAWLSNANVVAWLIEHGASLNARTKSNESPLNFAARNKNPEVFKAVLSAYKVAKEIKDTRFDLETLK